MENETIEMKGSRGSAQRKGFTVWRVVQLGILGAFVCLFFAWYALSPANVLGMSLSNGYAVLSYYSGNIDISFIMDENLNPIMLALFIMNMVVLLRIILMLLLPIFTPCGERRLGKMFYGVPVVVYLAFIILSIGLMVKIGSLELTVELFPIFILVFSILCLLATIISMAVIYKQKYGRLNIFHRNKAVVTSLNAEDDLQSNDKRLTVEALIWIFDALFLIASVVIILL